jgi:hypothetical protein
MVDNIPKISPKAVSHIAYQLTVAVRTFVLKEKEAKYPENLYNSSVIFVSTFDTFCLWAVSSKISGCSVCYCNEALLTRIVSSICVITNIRLQTEIPTKEQ